MDKMTKALITLALVFVTPLALACDYPGPPKDLPDGSTAAKDEMLAGVKAISGYQADMAEYLDCIEADQIVATQALADDDEEAKKRSKSNFDKKYNAAVDEQTKTVEMFNLEIRAFKAR
jgi:predicted outer membrane protein